MTDTVPSHLPAQPSIAIAPTPVVRSLSLDELRELTTSAPEKGTPNRAVEGVAAQAKAAAATTWQSQKQIVNLWSINQDRNSWIGVAGIGWQKLSNASDSGVVALTMLAANALVSKSAVNYRQESDGMVHEIYVF